MTFQLHPRIEADTVAVGRFPQVRVLLHRDARYPWVLLVPEREGAREIHDLPHELRHRLVDFSCGVAEEMQRLFAADKMNVAALGNMVPQLHLHHIARHGGDDAWPGPIWGAHPALEYTPEALEARVTSLRGAFGELPGFG